TIILTYNNSNEASVQISKSILNSTSSSFAYKQFQIPVTISIGISTGIYHNEINKMSFVETLIHQTNKAMYRVKEIGGKSYHLNTYAESKNVLRTYQV